MKWLKSVKHELVLFLAALGILRYPHNMAHGAHAHINIARQA